MAAARDEYDGYVGSVARMVREGKSADDIAKRLLEIETDNMGLRGDAARAEAAAGKLRRLVA